MRRSTLTMVVWLGLAVAAQAAEPRLAPERIVLSTPAGDVVLALYPDVAPKHVEQILHLVRLGVYDGTHFYRIEPTFVAQLSTALDRVPPLTPEQQAAIHPLPAEFSDLRHRRGVLSMAREDRKPDSAETSFSILLGDAPHLDGQYTIFGRVESGMEAIDELVKVPRQGSNRPSLRLEVRKAVVVDSPDDLRYLQLTAPHPVALPAEMQPSAPASANPAVLGGVSLMVLCGLVSFFGSGRLPGRILLSLNLVGVFIGSFLIFMFLVPVAMLHAWLAVSLFLGVLGLLKLMSRFESPA